LRYVVYCDHLPHLSFSLCTRLFLVIFCPAPNNADNLVPGFDGAEGVARVLPVKDGSTLTFEFHSWPNDYSKPSLDPGHKGPCAVYLKKVDSAIKDTGTAHGPFHPPNTLIQFD
jgi:hypothetical protein